VKQHKTAQKRGIGLYSYEQIKNCTAFDFFGVIILGTIVASLGIMLGYDQYHSATRRSTGGLITATVLTVLGIFFAHAGVIFWYRRLRKL
jgi:hypothetical protein